MMELFDMYTRLVFGATMILAALCVLIDALGAAVQVETSAPPYSFTHELFTDPHPQQGGHANAHPSTVLDIYTPLFPDKTPRLGDAWRYVLTAEVTE
jgi:hypothetical protein